MKTLLEHNRDRIAQIKLQNTYPKKNGIACTCGEELEDIDGLALMSNPPQRRVKCPKCGTTGYRII